MSQEAMQYDVVIVGAGPAGLSAAIRLKQHAPDLSVCILEKGAQVGSHILSGAVLEPGSLKKLLPERWQSAPFNTPVKSDALYFLTSKSAIKLPTPSPMQNHGNFIISLGEMCQFLAGEAEMLGVEIYPGFAAKELVFSEKNQLIGVKTGDMGRLRNGEQGSQFQEGMTILGKQTFFAEGCRGQLSQELIAHYHLREGKCPQTYGIGIKELWQVNSPEYQEGKVVHTIGWPLQSDTYGGSFIYHLKNNIVALGFVVGLDYQNPWLSPFEEMQRFKNHPMVEPLLTGGKRIGYGARALNEGGFQSLPKLYFPGGILIGDAAGFLNVPKIKGIHMAIESGMLAADAYLARKEELVSGSLASLDNYETLFAASPMQKELHAVRNIRPGFRYGLWAGMANAALETYILRGRSPWTLKNHADHQSLIPASDAQKIAYPKPDGVLRFDRLSSVYLTNTYHSEDQPCHLELKHPEKAITLNYQKFASPETRYCPAQVYEIIVEDDSARLQINAQNCIHCKTCDIKDPSQNIHWVAPEGGGGPNYQGM